jgi:integrase
MHPVAIYLMQFVGLGVGLWLTVWPLPRGNRMLTDAKARKLNPGEKPISVGGVTGLYLRAGSKRGTGKFILRFVSPTSGKRRDMGLGTYPEMGLADARKKALQAREFISMKLDPIEQRNAESSTETSLREIPTFEIAAYRTYEGIAAGFKNLKHSRQWISTLETYAFQHIGNKAVNALTTADFAEVLRGVWLEKQETASRVKQRCERVMTWCIANQFASTNPVSAVDALLPKQQSKSERVAHFPAVPWRDLPEVAKVILTPKTLSLSRQALLFLILTATRSGEVRGATWDEIDFENRIWTIPATRMKAGIRHRVPLNDASLGIIQARSKVVLSGTLIFSRNGNTPISDMTITKFLRDQKIPSDHPGRVATAHGFRSSFRDWASENGYSKDQAERALAHSIQNATEAAYHRTDQLEQRRSMMQDWARFVTGKQ